jgi:hypothetical protein
VVALPSIKHRSPAATLNRRKLAGGQQAALDYVGPLKKASTGKSVGTGEGQQAGSEDDVVVLSPH